MIHDQIIGRIRFQWKILKFQNVKDKLPDTCLV